MRCSVTLLGSKEQETSKNHFRLYISTFVSSVLSSCECLLSSHLTCFCFLLGEYLFVAQRSNRLFDLEVHYEQWLLGDQSADGYHHREDAQPGSSLHHAREASSYV